MNKEIKDIWCSALRSGDYPQSAGDLRNKYGYCCLGVLCDLAVQAGVIDEPVVRGNDYPVWLYDGKVSYLPVPVMDWAGVHESDPLVTDKNGALRTLAVLNDYPNDFRYIADVIEASL